MHTNDMSAGRRLCVCVEVETHFIHRSLSCKIAQDSTEGWAPTMLPDAHYLGATITGGARRGTPQPIDTEPKECLFSAIFLIENWIPRSFSATTRRTGPLNACLNTTQQALSTRLYSIVSTPSMPDLDEKTKNRLISPGRGETRLNSCVCEVHEGRYSTDNNSATRACCLVSIERARDP